MAQQKVRIIIPKGFTPSERLDIARDVITYIQERAINHNRGWNPETAREKKFPKYSEAYAKKKGVGLGDVDLVLSADMFNAMKMLTQRSGSITVGFDAGTPENGKAEGNQKGTYGQPSPIPGKARPFLGLTQAALKEILDKYDSED